MDTAPADSFNIIIVIIHEMHHADKQGIPVKLTKRVEVMGDKGFAKTCPELAAPFIALFYRGIKSDEGGRELWTSLGQSSRPPSSLFFTVE